MHVERKRCHQPDPGAQGRPPLHGRDGSGGEMSGTLSPEESFSLSHILKPWQTSTQGRHSVQPLPAPMTNWVLSEHPCSCQCPLHLQMSPLLSWWHGVVCEVSHVCPLPCVSSSGMRCPEKSKRSTTSWPGRNDSFTCSSTLAGLLGITM